MQTIALVSPVTALEFIQNDCLLSGEGPVLTVFSLGLRQKCRTSLTVLHQQRIHGIRPRNVLEAGDSTLSLQEKSGQWPTFYDLAVFGGKAVRVVQVQLTDTVHLENTSPIIELCDWILDVRWMSEQSCPLLCVALSHNSALLLDVKTETTLYHRSCSEGCLLYSALVLTHRSWFDTVLIGGTVFNQLVIWKTQSEPNCLQSKAQVERRLLGHSGVIFSIMYSKNEGVIASASDDRSVRIWQVGELGGNGGKCGDKSPVCLHVLYGHHARVFSVKFLDGTVFSAGEDGACLAWEKGKVVHMLKGHRAGGVRALAISAECCKNAIWVATGGADGGVRLWKLGVEPSELKGNKEKLVDLQFPMDRTDVSHLKKQNVKPKYEDFCSKSNISQHHCSSSILREIECQKTVDLENEQKANKSALTVDIGNFQANKTLPEQKECSRSHGIQDQSNAELPTQVNHNVGIGVPKVICTLDSKNSTWHDCSFIVCTDKGGVYQYSNQNWQQIWQGPVEFQSYCIMEIVSLKSEECLIHLCAVGNISGSVQIFPVSNSKNGLCLNCGNGKIHSLIWQKESEHRGAWLLASGSDGTVYRWWVQVKKNRLDVTKLSSFEVPNCAKRWLTAAVRVEYGKKAVWVCGDRRGSLLLYQDSQDKVPDVEKDTQNVIEKSSQATGELGLMEGTLKEKLPIDVEGMQESFQDYETTDKDQQKLKLTPGSILFGVHGKQGVTSVVNHFGHFYSTGRDGCVRIFQVFLKDSKDIVGKPEQEFELEIFRVQRACKGMEWLEKVLILETQYGHDFERLEEHERNLEDKKMTEVECRNRQSVQEARFAIVGFHGNHFVIWDPVCQERLLSVPCGGGHRSWSLWNSKKGCWTGDGALVFIKQGTVMASERSLTEENGKISWAIKEGIHGRGIGCVYRLGRIMSETNTLWQVIVTGGEDTSVTVLALNPQNGDVKVLAVLTDHISSLRALTAVVNQDERTNALSALVMSAGGRAQMQCYRLLIGCNDVGGAPICQVIQVSEHRLDEQWEKKRNRHKMVKMDPETRYMSVAVLEHTSDSLTLAVACSDGAIRLFSVSELNRHIDLLWESFHHQRCVLSIAACCLEDAKGSKHKLFFSAATDGQISVWDFTMFSSSNIAPFSPVLTFSAHQSGVNSLEIYPTQHKDFYQVTVASGGDDGQLTVSQLKIQLVNNSADYNPQIGLSVTLVNQSVVKLAHASPLTSLKFLNESAIVSTSCDQRVCLWRVCAAGIHHQRTLCSHVADAAALAVWRDKFDQKSGSEAEVASRDGEKSRDDEAEIVCTERSEEGEEAAGFVLICGQGLQLLHVTR